MLLLCDLVVCVCLCTCRSLRRRGSSMRPSLTQSNLDTTDDSEEHWQCALDTIALHSDESDTEYFDAKGLFYPLHERKFSKLISDCCLYNQCSILPS